MNYGISAPARTVFGDYSRSPEAGNPIASVLNNQVQGTPALIVLNPASNSLGFTVGEEVELLQTREECADVLCTNKPSNFSCLQSSTVKAC